MSPRTRDFDFDRALVPAADPSAPASAAPRSRVGVLHAGASACGHHLILAGTTLWRAAVAALRWIPAVRKIDADKEVRLRELEVEQGRVSADREVDLRRLEVEQRRIELDAMLEMQRTDAHRIVMILALEKTDPAHVAAVLDHEQAANARRP